MPERRRKFTPEFKDEAVKMVIDGSRPLAVVAREIHVNEGTLGNWVNKYRRARRRGATADRLRSGTATGIGTGEPGTAHESRVLGKATAFFAQDYR